MHLPKKFGILCITILLVIFFNIPTSAVTIRKKKNIMLFGKQIEAYEPEPHPHDSLPDDHPASPIATPTVTTSTNQVPEPRSKRPREEEDGVAPSQVNPSNTEENKQDPKRARLSKNWKSWYGRMREARKSENEEKRIEAEKYFKSVSERRKKNHSERMERIKQGTYTENDLKIHERSKERSRNWKSKNYKQIKNSLKEAKLKEGSTTTKTTTYTPKQREWRLQNKDKLTVYIKNWKENHRERVREINRNSARRSRQKIKLALKSVETEQEQQPPTSLK